MCKQRVPYACYFLSQGTRLIYNIIFTWLTVIDIDTCSSYYSNFLKYHHAGARALRNQFTEGVWPLTITNISCNGSENNLLECTYSTETISACANQYRDAAVICQGTCVCIAYHMNVRMLRQ